MQPYLLSSEAGIEVFFEPAALANIFLAIHISPVEISGVGKVRHEGNIYTIEDNIAIFKQAVSGVHTVFDDDMRGHWLHEMVAAGRGAEINNFRLWWHSHVNMPARFSGTDHETIDEKLFDQNLKVASHEYWISFVGNKKGGSLMRLDVFKPNRLPPIYIDNAHFTDPMTNKEIIRSLMVERQGRMFDLVKKNLSFETDDARPFETILGGIFGV